jgi:predicted regulator of Ras-like GTPase activity (Roadblock/LC7/MglB family)
MFREVLQDILKRTEGCLGVLIMGFDGIVVEEVWQAGIKPETSDVSMAEYTSLLRNAQRINSGSRLARLHEMTISRADEIWILRVVNDDYFLAMIIAAAGNFGRGRYELHRAELLLFKELAV